MTDNLQIREDCPERIPIKEYEELYEIDINGNIWNAKTGNKKRQFINDSGYLIVSLWKTNKGKQYRVHRLIAQHFIANPFNKQYINHKNGIKTDNRLENLEWCTKAENNIHAIRTGLNSTEEANKASRKPIILIINGDIHYFESILEASEKTGYHYRTITRWLSSTNRSRDGISAYYWYENTNTRKVLEGLE